MKKYSIEYSHIYVSQSFGHEQRESCKQMRERSIIANGDSVSRHILIDDYSTATGLERFDNNDFFLRLDEIDANPNHVFLESNLADYCRKLSSKIKNKSLRKSIQSYYKTRKIWPCSMCIATWYLMRLGEFEHDHKELIGDKIITVLPDRYRTPEAEAQDIIVAMGLNDALDNIEVVFFKSSFDTYSDWSQFDTKEYVDRNYLRHTLPEDKVIMNFLAEYLQENCEPASLARIADVGAGPNLYPSLTIKPYICDDGIIELIDPVESNRQFLDESKNNIQIWNEFQYLLHDKDPGLYSASAELIKQAIVKDGDIFDLPENKYDLVVSFFVAESITDKQERVNSAVEALKSAVKPGGILVTAHMLGSSGYFAGMLTSFPSTPITKDHLTNYYSNFKQVKMQTTSHNQQYDPRKGYKGMAVAAGIKPNA